MNIRKEYSRTEARGQTRHCWAVADDEAKIGVHLWVAYYGDTPNNVYKCMGGVEVHRGNKPTYRESDTPDNEHCWLLRGSCWHDGSSLAAERYMRMFCDGDLDDTTAFNAVLSRLQSELANVVAEAQ